MAPGFKPKCFSVYTRNCCTSYCRYIGEFQARPVGTSKTVTESVVSVSAYSDHDVSIRDVFRRHVDRSHCVLCWMRTPWWHCVAVRRLMTCSFSTMSSMERPSLDCWKNPSLHAAVSGRRCCDVCCHNQLLQPCIITFSQCEMLLNKRSTMIRRLGRQPRLDLLDRKTFVC